MILPGAVLGVLGGGQLGRMFAIAARRMGYRVHVFAPARGTPAGQVADREVCAEYVDTNALARFADAVSAITFEFENVPSAAIDAIAGRVPVRPRGEVLRVAQNRLREKTFLRDHGFPTAPFVHVDEEAALAAAVDRVGLPAVLKSAGSGYDGKGQTVIRERQALDSAWSAIGGVEAVLEGFVDFACEVSVVAARGVDGSFVHYGVIENRHRNHILDLSLPGAPLPADLFERALAITRDLFVALDVVGVSCVEFFVTREGGLLVNELAPRPHNSGHFSVDASVTSQFEQQVRALCGLPLGDTALLRPAAMINLLGDLWAHGEPNWGAALSDPAVRLHLYGKDDARAGRKMGHITCFGDDREQAARRALAAREALSTKS